MPHISYFSKGLMPCRSEGDWVIVGKPRDMKKTRPEALFTPSYASGRVLGQAS